jgi:stage IV sporulation protein FB
MLFAEPAPSQGDLHFRLLGVPVRVSPYFWLATVILQVGVGSHVSPLELLIWIGVVFCSILIHELGHATLQRCFGGRPRIILHGFGGLAVCPDCDRRAASQILISLAGPAAGFLAAVVTLCIVRASGHAVGWSQDEETPLGTLGISILGGRVYWQPFASLAANILLYHILFVNIFWGLVNLLPVYPLDGGRVSRELCTLGNARRGIVLSLWISIVTAGLVAAYVGVQWGSIYLALMFCYLAYMNYQTLQAYQKNSW